MTLTAVERWMLTLLIFTALLAIVIGYGFKEVGSGILKDFLLFTTGAGVAFILARAGSRAAAIDRVRSLCNRSVQRLGLTAYRLRETASQLRINVTSPTSPEAQIAFTLESLAEQSEVSIGDLEEMAGTKLGLDPLVMDALAGVKAAAEEAETGTKEKLLSAIKTIEKQVAGIPRPVVATPPRLERAAPQTTVVVCTQCGEKVPVGLGALPGSTASANCRGCGARVRVHRGQNGQVTVVSEPRIRISCPDCGSEIWVLLKADHGTEVRNCMACNARIIIDAKSGAVVRSEKGTPLNAFYTLQGSSAIVTCPNCDYVIKVKAPEGYRECKVNCARCTSLIIATVEKAPAVPASASSG